MNSKFIYLDYAATTPIDKRVAKIMSDSMFSGNEFGNANSQHIYGNIANKLIHKSQQQLASLLSCHAEDLFWLATATEANNVVLQGIFNYYSQIKHYSKIHIITTTIEHKSILETCKFLASRGCEITYLPVDTNGNIDLNKLQSSITQHTALIAISWVNNEIGAIQNISAISNIAHENNVLLHVDAAQALGKIIIDLRNIQIDFLCCSSHKIYGPKGVAALYVRKHKLLTPLVPLIYGGSKLHSLTAGTLANHQIIGFGAAAEIMQAEYQQDYEHIYNLKMYLWQQLQQRLSGLFLNGNLTNSVPHILNFCIEKINKQKLFNLLQQSTIAISFGAACSSHNINFSSHVIRALDRKPSLAKNSLRLSLGRFSTTAEIEYTINYLVGMISNLRNNLG